MKKLLTLALALSLATLSSHALAANANCTVTAINEESITLDCGTKAESFKIGDKVKTIIKAAKKQKAIEGC